MIKVISLDIGGTLIKYDDESLKYNFNELALITNIEYKQVVNTYKNIFQKRIDSFDNLVIAFCNELKIKPNNKIIDFFKHKFYDNNIKENTSENDIKTIKKLKEYGYKVILFSNACCLQNNKIDKTLSNIVDEIFYSYELGYTKSDKESYRIIERKLNKKPEEFLHIGDTLKSDYIKPIENGWNALYLGVSINNEINSINKLEDVLEYLKINNPIRGK